MTTWHEVDEGVVLRYSVEVSVDFDVLDDVGVEGGAEGWCLQGDEDGGV